MASDAKDKGPISLLEDKKKATLTPVVKKRETSVTAQGEGTSAIPIAALEPRASILRSPSVVEKILGGVIPPTDKEKMEKPTLDQVVTKFFHIVD